MKKILKRLMQVILSFIVLVIVVVGGFYALRSMNLLVTDDTMIARFPAPDHEATSFEDLVLKPSPNQFLVCDPAVCAAVPHRVNQIYDIPAVNLRRHFSDIIDASPRITKLASGDHFMQNDYIQRSAIMQYPDLITVRYVRLTEETSTLYIYSRSVFGYGDGGVNKARVEGWLSALGQPEL